MSVHRLCRAIVGDLTLTAVTDVTSKEEVT